MPFETTAITLRAQCDVCGHRCSTELTARELHQRGWRAFCPPGPSLDHAGPEQAICGTCTSQIEQTLEILRG